MKFYEWPLYKIVLFASVVVITLCVLADELTIFIAFIISVIPITIRHTTKTYRKIISNNINYAGWYVLTHPTLLFAITLLILR